MLAICAWSLDAPRVYEQAPATRVFAADFDGDGRVDVGSAVNGAFAIRYNTASGTLSLPQTLPLDVIGVADVAGNALPDLIVSGIGIAQNLGDRDFGAPRVIMNASTVVAADFTNDGRNDLLLRFADRFAVYERMADDSFVAHASQPLVDASPLLATGDANGDGNRDVVLVANDRITLSVYEGDGRGGFAAPRMLYARATLTALTLGDLDGDRRDEIITVSQMSELYFGRIEIFDALAGTSTLHRIGSDRFYSQIRLHDLDGDGRPELVLTTEGAAQNVAFLSSVRTEALAAVRPELFTTRGAIAVANLRGDARPEVVMPTATGFTTIDPLGTAAGLGALDGVNHVAGDLDGDGADEVVFQLRDGSLVVAQNDGAGTFAVERVPWEFDHDAYTIEIDHGRIVLQSPTKVLVFAKTGGVWQLANVYRSQDLIYDAALGRFSEDEELQILTLTHLSRPPNLVGLRIPGEFEFADWTPLFGVERGSFTTADLNGDGFTDVVVMADFSRSSILKVYYSSRNGDFFEGETLASAPSRSSLHPPHVADFDGDGRLDVAFVDSRRELTIVYAEGDGFGEPITMAVAPRAAAAVMRTADVNQDGIADIIVSADFEHIVFQGTPGGLLRRDTFFASGAPTLLRLRRGGALSLLTSTMGIMEGACKQTRRRGVRH